MKAIGGIQLMPVVPKEETPPTKSEDAETKASVHRSNWTLVVKVNVDDGDC